MKLRPIIKKLTWEDFKGLPELNSKYDACLNWGIYYSYSSNNKDADINSKLNLKIHIDVGTSSWYRKGKETLDLLNHENGHFLLAYLYGHKFNQEVQNNYNSSTMLSLELENHLKMIFDKNFQECVQIQEKYDDQTDHGLNLAQQKRWDEFLEHLTNCEESINFNSFYLF